MQHLLHAICMALALAPVADDDVQYSGSIVFGNVSDTGLEWVTVAGFPDTPPCGVLIPKSQKGSYLSPQVLPAKVVITWRFKGEADQKTELTIPAEARRAAKGELRFEFGKMKKWSVGFKA